ncbi:MAG: HprK-related kinase A [Gemmatimonadota bacterium]
MKVAELAVDELADRLRETRLVFRSGPFFLRLGTPLGDLAPVFARLYAHHTVATECCIVDGTLELKPRGWRGREAVFLVDGHATGHPFDRALAWPYVEWGFNWLIGSRMHHLLMVHAAVVERQGRALVMPGLSGSGKSTLCAALMAAGWRLLSDEFLMVDPASGALLPLPRPIALKGRAIDLIRARMPDAVFGPAYPDTRKGLLSHLAPPAHAVAREAEPAVARWIVFPRFTAGAAAHLTPIPRGEAWLQIGENSFNYQLRGRNGFEEVGRLVRGAACFALEFGDLDAALARLDEVCVP